MIRNAFGTDGIDVILGWKIGPREIDGQEAPIKVAPPELLRDFHLVPKAEGQTGAITNIACLFCRYSKGFWIINAPGLPNWDRTATGKSRCQAGAKQVPSPPKAMAGSDVSWPRVHQCLYFINLEDRAQTLRGIL